MLALLIHPSFGQTKRLQASDFPELPRNIAAELEHRGCTIPQVPMINGRHNVIKGQFAKAGQTDWAVLCSTKEVSSILIFWNGSEINPAEMERSQESNHLQGWTDSKMVFSRAIAAVDRAYIMDRYKAYGGEKPPPMDHQGINDEFVGKASVVLYFYQGKWLHLSGAD